MKKLFYTAFWFFRARFLGRHKPLQSVIFITDRCNLRCQHCALAANTANPADKTFEQVRQEMEYCYAQGSRFIDFEGGEPTLWRDGDRTVNDLIDEAKRMGFFSCTITTNAQRPFAGSHADSIWVSMDGTQSFHDKVRGEGTFQRLEQNIASCGHKHVSVNMAINTLNLSCVADAIEYVHNNPHIEMISFSFHTPYAGTEALFVDWDTRRQIIDTIIAYKKKGYKIMNSVSALKLMKDNKFEKQCWVSNFILPDGTKLTECTGKTAGVCDRCGFGMAAEMRSVFDFKIDTIIAGSKLRM